jgi:hypothetical protein
MPRIFLIRDCSACMCIILCFLFHLEFYFLYENMWVYILFGHIFYNVPLFLFSWWWKWNFVPALSKNLYAAYRIPGSFQFLCGVLRAWVSYRIWKRKLALCGFCSGISLYWWWYCCVCSCSMGSMHFPLVSWFIKRITSCIGTHSCPCCSTC